MIIAEDKRCPKWRGEACLRPCFEFSDCYLDGHHVRYGVFVLHNCYRCRHGAKACVHGDPRRCENLHARND